MEDVHAVDRHPDPPGLAILAVRRQDSKAGSPRMTKQVSASRCSPDQLRPTPTRSAGVAAAVRAPADIGAPGAPADAQRTTPRVSPHAGRLDLQPPPPRADGPRARALRPPRLVRPARPRPLGARRRSPAGVDRRHIGSVLAEVPAGPITRLRLDLMRWTDMRPDHLKDREPVRAEERSPLSPAS